MEDERFSIVKVNGESRWIGVRKNSQGKGLEIFSSEPLKKERKLVLSLKEVCELKVLLNSFVTN